MFQQLLLTFQEYLGFSDSPRSSKLQNTDDSTPSSSSTLFEGCSFQLLDILHTGFEDYSSNIFKEFLLRYQSLSDNKESFVAFKKEHDDLMALIRKDGLTYLKKRSQSDEYLLRILNDLEKVIREMGEFSQNVGDRLESNSATSTAKGFIMANGDKDRMNDLFERARNTQTKLLLYLSNIDKINESGLNKILNEIHIRLAQPVALNDVIRKYHAKFRPNSRKWIRDEFFQWFTNSDAQTSIPSLTSPMAAPSRTLIKIPSGISFQTKLVFWLSAGAGMGKTTFAAELVHNFKEERKDALLGAVFFKFNELSSQDPVLLLKNLVYQIAKGFPLVAEDLLRILKENADERSIEGIFEVYLAGALALVEKYYGRQPRLLVFDALDESGTQGSKPRQELLELFKRSLLRTLPSWVKLFVTGRPEADIEETLRACAHTIEEDDPRHLEDLHEYIDFSVRQVFQQFDALAEEDGKSVAKEEVKTDTETTSSENEEAAIKQAVDLIFQRSEGKFVYTAVVVDQINDWYQDCNDEAACEEGAEESDEGRKVAWFDLNSFQAKLKTLPMGLDECYRKTFLKLHQSLSVSLARQFFLLMVGCLEPLSEEAVRYMLDLNSSFTDPTCSRYQRLVSSAHTVFSLNAERRFVPYHKSIVDWLTDERRSGDLYCNPSEAHLFIVRGLLRKVHVSLTGFEGVLDWPSEGVRLHFGDVEHLQLQVPFGPNDNKENSSGGYRDDFLLLYALKHLPQHLSRSSSKMQLGFLTYFLLTNLTWLQLSLELLGIGNILTIYWRLLSSRSKWLPETFSKELLRDVKLISHFLKYISPIKVANPSQWWIEICQQILLKIRKASDRSKSKQLLRLLKDSEDYLRKTNQFVIANGGQTDEGNSFVLQLSLLQDGRLASGSSDGWIKVWNIATGQCDLTLVEHEEAVIAMFTLRDGRLSTGSWDESIKIWTISGDGHAKNCSDLTLLGHTGYVSALNQLDDDRLISASGDESIKIWNLHSGVCEKTIWGHLSDVYSLYPLSNNRLLSGSEDTFIKLWNIDTGECELTLTGHSREVLPLLMLADGRLASGSFDKHIKIWNLSSGLCELTLTGHAAGIHALALLFDGRLASGSLDKSIKIWNVENGQCEHTLIGHKRTIDSLCILSDGRIASGSYDKTIKVWGLKNDVSLSGTKRPMDETDGNTNFNVLSNQNTSSYSPKVSSWKCDLTLIGSVGGEK